jgi:hypothetical protein
VVGNGGVGSPIAASLAAAGVGTMGLFDPNQAASDGLGGRLAAHYPAMQIRTGSKDPDRYDLVVNVLRGLSDQWTCAAPRHVDTYGCPKTGHGDHMSPRGGGIGGIGMMSPCGGRTG